MAKSKNYVLDTTVLLYDPEAILAYPEGDVVLPISVIEEIDKFKRALTETGKNARRVSQILDTYRAYGNLSKGLTLNLLFIV
jgi:PhoH-like ATPase